MGDWTKQDIGPISEEDFPICCQGCDCSLSGLGDAGRCPACGLSFSRRQLLWATYGPEAFADPPIVDDEINGSVRSSAFAGVLLFGIVLVAVLPIAAWVSRDWLEVNDLWFLLFAWLVVVASSIWLMVVRHRGNDHNRGGPSPTVSLALRASLKISCGYARSRAVLTRGLRPSRAPIVFATT